MKTVIFVIFILLSFQQAFATCALPVDGFDDLSAIVKFAAPSSPPPQWYLDYPDVSKSPCKHAPPTEEEMLAFLNGVKTGKSKKLKTAGVELKDDEGLLKVFSQIHDRDPNFSKEPWRYTKGTTVTLPEGCKDVMCAMTNLYGREHGLQLLYMRAKFGFNSSALAVGETNADEWTTKDMGTVLAMLNDFPQKMFPVMEGSRFIHVNAEGRGGHKMVAESFVQVYLGWHNLPESQKTTSLAHEVGHIFAIPRKETPEWLNISGWSGKKIDEKKTEWTMGKPEQAVLEYAKTNPDEDFGETFFQYRYNGAKMQARFPEKYEYMKNNVFMGKEFVSRNSCD